METDEVLRDLGYEVLRDLREGQYSTVKLAKSKKYQKTVALKIMQINEHVKREVAILKRLKHPHIVSVLEIFEMDGGLVCIVMEAAAKNLGDAKKFQSVIPTDQARTWFSQLVSAVVYLHKKHIAHRDIKCENVLLTSDNQVQLSDFGFGRFSRGFPDITREYCGTPAFAAPEVLLERPYDPKKADVWSLGVVLYWMVVGRLPFRDWFDLPGCQRKPIYFPERLEEPCRDLISYMLRYSYLKRPSAKKVAQHPWLQMEREPVERPIPSSSQSQPVKSSPRVQELQKQKTDQEEEEAGPSRDETSNPQPPAAQDEKPLQPAEEDAPSSSSLIRDAQKTPSTSKLSSSKDELEFFSAQPSIEEEVQAEPEYSRRRAGGSETCRNAEVDDDKEDDAAVKRAAKAYIAAPIDRAPRSLRRRMKRFFKRTSTAEAPTCFCSEQKRDKVAEAENVLPQPAIKEETKRQKFLQFKILKKKKKKIYVV